MWQVGERSWEHVTEHDVPAHATQHVAVPHMWKCGVQTHGLVAMSEPGDGALQLQQLSLDKGWTAALGFGLRNVRAVLHTVEQEGTTVCKLNDPVSDCRIEE